MKQHKQRNEFRHPKKKSLQNRLNAYNRQYDALERQLDRQGCPPIVKRELLQKIKDRQDKKAAYDLKKQRRADYKADRGWAVFLKSQGVTIVGDKYEDERD